VQHDALLRAKARATYDACYPNDDWALLRFEEAERLGTVQYRHAVDAAQRNRALLAATGEQLFLFAVA
jgi:hypothetical protein